MAAESSTASAAPRTSALAPRCNMRLSPIIEARPMPKMGDINGATSIAPMMTAAELVSKPSVAMLLESTTNRKKSKPGEASGVISATIWARSSAVSGLTSPRTFFTWRFNQSGSARSIEVAMIILWKHAISISVQFVPHCVPGPNR